MKHKMTMASVAFLLLGLGELYAQQTPIVSGGEATGSGGSFSYSIGQIVYTTNTGTGGSVTQGVQQPFEISVATGIETNTINLDLSVHPNPTSSYLKLKIENLELENVSYQLHDMQGRVIESGIVSNNVTNINLEEQPKATYFLKVTENNQNVKTFKVIKN
jgi:hypothetical protein